MEFSYVKAYTGIGNRPDDDVVAYSSRVQGL